MDVIIFDFAVSFIFVITLGAIGTAVYYKSENNRLKENLEHARQERRKNF